MNVEQLKATVISLLEIDDETEFESTLASLANVATTLSSQPQSVPHQTEYTTLLNKLQEAEAAMKARFNPTLIKRTIEIGGQKYFLTRPSHDITEYAKNNVMTPAATAQFATKLNTKRVAYLNHLKELDTSLDAIGFTNDKAEPDAVQIGFCLPRDLFSNDLDGLIKELKEIKFIIKIFSELATGSAESIQLDSISTTDPSFYFNLAQSTIFLVGQASVYIVNFMKQMEEVKRLRAATAALSIDNLGKIVSMFDNEIENEAQKAIRSEAKRLAEESIKNASRQHETITHLEMALTSMFARFERGMTVELRLPAQDDAASTGGNEETQPIDSVRDFASIQENLIFPKITGAPILQLPRSAEDISATDDDVGSARKEGQPHSPTSGAREKAPPNQPKKRGRKKSE